MMLLKAYVDKTLQDDEGMWIVASTKDQDRMGDVIEPTAFANLQEYLSRNPVILFAHDSYRPPIGKAVAGEVTDRGLLLKIVFANTQFAQEIKQLYDEGFMNAFSVGALPIEADRSDSGTVYKKVDLLEVSAVPIPANAHALVVRSLDNGEMALEKYNGTVTMTKMQGASKSNQGLKSLAAGKTGEAKQLSETAKKIKLFAKNIGE